MEDIQKEDSRGKGEVKDLACAQKVLYSIHSTKYGYEGICLSEKLVELAGCDISVETASLSQISVAIMKHFASNAK